MASICLSYARFKAKVDETSMDVEHYETEDIYFLLAYSANRTELQCKIPKDCDEALLYKIDYP